MRNPVGRDFHFAFPAPKSPQSCRKISKKNAKSGNTFRSFATDMCILHYKVVNFLLKNS